MIHPDKAYKNLLNIIGEYRDKLPLMNEAETRAKVIDRVLKECLDWSEDSIRREDRVESGYTDYQLLISGTCRIVIEAKRAGDYFDIPKTKHRRTYKLSGAIESVTNLMDAINQVRAYCTDVGSKYGAVFNGYQLVIFPAISIGKSWKEGYCTIFHSFDDLKENFNLLWNTLAFENVKQGSLIQIIDKGKELVSFRKVLKEIHNPEQLWERNYLYTYIQPIADLVFSELLDETRAEVLKECYVFERSNRQLGDELKSYFVDKLPYFAEKYKIKDIFEREGRAKVFERTFAEKQKLVTQGSTIVLVGGIGSGKSTFLHRYFKIILSDYETLLWFYIDFRHVSLKEEELEEYITNKIIEQWYEKYATKLTVNLEALGFSVIPDEGKTFLSKLFNLLHTVGFSITVIIDNVDQHDLGFQEKIFLISSHLTDTLKTVTILALREETFIASTRVGVFNAYDIPKFHIASPDFLSLIKARLNFTIDLLKVKDTKYPEGIVSDLIKYFGIIRGSLDRKNEQSQKLVNFIDSISVGNMRDALTMFTYFTISGNTNVKEMFHKNEVSGWYQIAYHQFIKSVMLGEHRYYSQERSHLMNIFDFDTSLSDSHFNSLRIMKYLFNNNNKRSPIGRGYVSIDELINQAELTGIRRTVIYDSLLRMANWRLIEFDNQSKKDVHSASYAKITNAGEYYLSNLKNEFVYLDGVLVDTPLSDESVFRYIRHSIDSTELTRRLERTERFVDYLEKAESAELKLHPEYVSSELTNYYFGKETAEQFRKEKVKIMAQAEEGDSVLR
jgi:predicted type IV restriction endonuclease